MHALTDMSENILIVIDIIKQKSEITIDDMTTLKKLLNIRIDESAGKIRRADIRRAPTSRMPTTITRAVRAAIRAL